MRYLFFTMLIMSTFSLSAQNAQKKFALYYVGDPMCSWCYGITNEWQTLIGHYPEAEVHYIMGGLRPNGTEAMADLKGFLQEHWEEVHLRTGLPFKLDILERDMVYNTEPACRAVVTFRHFNAEKTRDFFKKVQHAFYVENHNPYLASNYAAIAEELGVNKADFLSYFLSPSASQETIADFEKARNLGASGFPTILTEINGSIFVLSRGYQTATSMHAYMQKLLGK